MYQQEKFQGFARRLVLIINETVALPRGFLRTIHPHFSTMRQLTLLFLMAIGRSVWGQTIPVYTFYDSVRVNVGGRALPDPWAGGLNSAQFSTVDLNGDRRPDLVVFDRTANVLLTFINTASGYQSAPEYAALFPPELENWCLLVDYDGDGRKDIFTHANLGVRVFRNETPVGGQLTFRLARQSLPVRGLSGNVFNLSIDATDIPAITDVDDDGDLDILNFIPAVGNSVEFNRNVSRERFGHSDSLIFERATARWGNFDECAQCNEFKFGPSTCRSEAVEHAGSTLLALDLNGDSIKDLLLGDVSCSNLIALQNVGTAREANFTGFNPAFPTSRPVNIPVFPAAYTEDVDQDGILDLLVSPNADRNDGLQIDFVNSAWFYKNIGTNAQPDFQFRQTNFLQDRMIEVGEGSKPAFVDVDGDGDLDMLVSTAGQRRSAAEGFRARIYLFDNTGTSANPQFNLLNDNYLDLNALNVRFARISVADLNNDQMPDLVLSYTPNVPLSSRGQLAYVLNTATTGQGLRVNLANLQPLMVEGFGTNDEALFINVDADNDLDLLVGKTTGALQYHENTGNLAFSLRNPQAGGIAGDLISLGLSLAVADLTRDGQPDLITGDRGGNLLIYPNFLRNFGGNWTPQRDFVLNRLTNRTSAYAFGYLAGGVLPAVYQTDLVLGTTAGGLRYLRSSGVITAIGEDGLASQENYQVYPNPTAGQLQIRVGRPAQVEVFSLIGQPIWAGRVVGSQQLDLSGLASGMYVVQFTHTSGKVVRKVTVQR